MARFESSVISLGNETRRTGPPSRLTFESSVISLGNETRPRSDTLRAWFESSVISLGNETVPEGRVPQDRLRVVSFRWGTKLADIKAFRIPCDKMDVIVLLEEGT